MSKIISFKNKGDFSKTKRFFYALMNPKNESLYDKYGKEGIAALAQNTPRRTGRTAESWDFRVVHEKNRTRIEWFNKNIQNGVLIALILQYGHATKNGGWVEGTDYVNPAIKPIFDELADNAWKEVVGQ